MKSRYYILFAFVSQQITAYYDDVQDAVYSVQGNFGRLITDMETDVRDSIDCALLRTGHILDYDETSTYRRLCNQEAQPDPSYNSQPQVEYYVPPAVYLFSNDIEQGTQSREDELNNNINDARSEINDTIFDFLSRHPRRYMDDPAGQPDSFNYEEIQMKEYTDSISKNISKQLEDIKSIRNNETIAILLKEMQLLHNKEKNYTNSSNEMHQVIIEILQELKETQNANKSKEFDKFKEVLLRIEKESNNTYEDIEKRFEQWHILENKHLDEIISLLLKQQNYSQTNNTPRFNLENVAEKKATEITLNQRKSNSETQQIDITTTRSTNDITTEAVNMPNKGDTEKNLKTTMVPPILTTKLITTTSVITTTTTTTTPTTTTNPTTTTTTTTSPTINIESTTTNQDLDDYDSFFSSGDKNSIKEAIKSAASVIEDSKQSQSIFDKLFKSMDFST